MIPTNLYESLFILHKCNTNLNRLSTLIKSYEAEVKENESYLVLFVYYINLETVSFLEEFNKGFYQKTEVTYKTRISDVRSITSPILKRINKWKDLREFRNQIVAHPWRGKEGTLVIPDQQYNVPRNWFEAGLLAILMNYVWELIRAEFQKEVPEMLEYMESKIPPPKAARDYSGINTEQKEIFEEVYQVCKKLNKPYYLKVMQFEFPSDTD